MGKNNKKKDVQIYFRIEDVDDVINIKKQEETEFKNLFGASTSVKYDDAPTRKGASSLNLNDKIHQDIFKIANGGIDDLKHHTNEEQQSIKYIREIASKYLFRLLIGQVAFLIFISLVDIFWKYVPASIYQVFCVTVIGNLVTLIAIILKYGFTNYMGDYYAAWSKTIEVLGEVNNRNLESQEPQKDEKI